MGNFARIIIDAIQHSMLGSLLFRLFWPCSWLIWFIFDHLTGYEPGQSVVLLPLVLVPGGLFLIWLLGAFANHRPRPSSALERVQDPPANGFEAWNELPAGGLRPPRLMRWLVGLLGNSPGRRSSWFAVTLVLGAWSLAVALAAIGSTFWEKIHPALGDASNRLLPALVCAGVVTAFVVRGWASDQRKLLELPPSRSF